MSRHRLRAPALDGALLAIPPLDEAGERLRANSSHLARWDFDFQGRRAFVLRPMARQQVLEASKRYLSRFGLDLPGAIDLRAPLIVAGHQPELFHPGVWVKNFALGGLARQLKATTLNLVVDNDIPKGSSIRVPRRVDGTLRAQAVEFDNRAGEVPYEDLTVGDELLFRSFPERVLAVLDGLVSDPVLHDFWPRALRFGEQTNRTGLRFALARRELEAAWGTHNWEVPLSAVCESDAFYWFTSHLLAHLPRFQGVHNAALARYRAAEGIRSKHHPVPALGRQGEWLEAPFWIWRAREPRRRPLLVRQLARTMELRIAGDDTPILEIPLAPDREACCAVEQLRTLAEQQIRLRTRALTTTLFSRLLLGDLFLHGIGGAKYDEVGDVIIHHFYGIEPPSYLTLSMTLWPGIATDPASEARLHAVERSLRDLTYNPDRHLPGPLDPTMARWIEAKRLAIAGPVDSHAERVARFQQIRRCNEAMEPAVAPLRAEREAERAQVLHGMKHNAVAQSREFAFVLHSQARLRQALSQALGPAYFP